MGWIGVDLDGTLVHYDHWRGAAHIGEPVPLMVEQVKRWLNEGVEVKIFTARVSQDGTPGRQRDAALAVLAIQDKCLTLFGEYLPITNQKDYAMIEAWDDRAVTVEMNTGIALVPSLYKSHPFNAGLGKS